MTWSFANYVCVWRSLNRRSDRSNDWILTILGWRMRWSTRLCVARGGSRNEKNRRTLRTPPKMRHQCQKNVCHHWDRVCSNPIPLSHHRHHQHHHRRRNVCSLRWKILLSSIQMHLLFLIHHDDTYSPVQRSISRQMMTMILVTRNSPENICTKSVCLSVSIRLLDLFYTLGKHLFDSSAIIKINQRNFFLYQSCSRMWRAVLWWWEVVRIQGCLKWVRQRTWTQWEPHCSLVARTGATRLSRGKGENTREVWPWLANCFNKTLLQLVDRWCLTNWCCVRFSTKHQRMSRSSSSSALFFNRLWPWSNALRIGVTDIQWTPH